MKKASNKEFIHENSICYYKSPLGGMTLAGDGEALTGLWFDNQLHFGDSLNRQREEKELPVFRKTILWLDIYFSGKIPDFTPALNLRGTPFRKTVWEILLDIPYGETISYGEIAKKVAEQSQLPRMSAQAIGGAVGHNPIALIIPCHRVIGSDGSLTGYAGGMERKARLLQLEKETRFLKD